MGILLKKSLIVLSAAFCLAGCGSYTISIDKGDKEQPTTENTASNAAPATETKTEATATTQAAKPAQSSSPSASSTDSILRTETDNSGSYVVPTRDVNVRATPSISGKIIGSGAGNEPLIYLNEKVYTSDNRVWLKVQTDGQTVGYVSSRYAEVTSGTIWDSYYEDSYSYVVVTESEANIRYNTDQNDSSAVIEKATRGETFEYTGVTIPASGRDWYEVYSSSGEIGYISSRVSDLK